MIIQIIDHGADLLMVGQRRKAKQYLIGNPLLAIQVNRYDIRAALYAPLRVLVFESEPGRTVVEFDQPSTLFGQFGRSEVTAVGVEDDDKLEHRESRNDLVKGEVCAVSLFISTNQAPVPQLLG
jgi:hypothetical protein